MPNEGSGSEGFEVDGGRGGIGSEGCKEDDEDDADADGGGGGGGSGSGCGCG